MPATSSDGSVVEDGIRNRFNQKDNVDECLQGQSKLRPVAPKTSINFYCRLLVQHPGCMLGTALFVQTLFPVLSVLLHSYGSDVFPADFTDVPLTLEHLEAYQRVVAWNLRNGDPSAPMYYPPVLTEAVKRQVPTDIIELFYETKDGTSILTREYLKAILEFENGLIQMKDYSRFCVVKEDRCILTRSLPRLIQDQLELPAFGGNFRDSSNHSSDERLQRILYSFSKDENMKDEFADFLGRKKVTFENHKQVISLQLRSYFFVAWVDASTESDTYTTKQFATNVVGPTMLKLRESGIAGQPNLDFFYYNGFLYYDYLRTQVIQDLLLVGGSFCFIFTFLWIQTKSLFVTIFGVYGIATNFFAANILYRYVCDYRYFGVFHVLSIFIILGIGVDDIFVYSDAWTASSKGNHGSLQERVSECYRKASATMLVTSLSTAIAFLVNAFSPLLAIGSFGLFSALLVIANYLSVVSFFPAVIVFHHVKLSHITCCCKPECSIVHRTLKKLKIRRSIGPKLTKSGDDYIDEKVDSVVVEKPQKEAISQIICRFYLKVVTNFGVQVTFLLSSACLIAFLSWSATRLEVDSKPVTLYRDTHPLGYSLSRRNKNFDSPYYTQEELVQIHLVWGIKGMDRSVCHKTDWKNCKGKIVWDDNFNMNLYRAQADILNLCKTINQFSEDQMEKLMVRSSNGKPEMKCFFLELEKFMKQNLDVILTKIDNKIERNWEILPNREQLRDLTLSTRKTSTGFPTSDLKVQALMSSRPQVYNMTLVRSMPFFQRYFETATLLWLDDGYSIFETGDLNLNNWKNFGAYIGNSIDSQDLITTKIRDYNIVYGTQMKYLAVVINTTVPSNGFPFGKGLRIFQRWEDFLIDQKRVMSAPLQSGFVATPDRNEVTNGLWHWMAVQEVLTNQAVFGVAVSLCLAFPILTISTNDILLGLLATFTIGFATVSVVGMIPLLGWKLGVLESMNLTLVVGLAIDYIVHIAEGYHLSDKPTRRQKVEQVISEVGISVTSGAISTLGASFFMLFAQIVFFMQFGLFIFCTVLFAIFYSLGVFTIILLLFGPESDTFALTRLVCIPLRNFFVGMIETKIQKMNDADRLAIHDDRSNLSGGCDTEDTCVAHDSPTLNKPLPRSGGSSEPDEHYTTDSTLPVSTDDHVSTTSIDSTKGSHEADDVTLGEVTELRDQRLLAPVQLLKENMEEEILSSGYESTNLTKISKESPDGQQKVHTKYLPRLQSVSRRPPSVLRRLKNHRKSIPENQSVADVNETDAVDITNQIVSPDTSKDEVV